MRVSYISPSSIPSKSANSIHVIMQCHALSQVASDVSLFAQRTILEYDKLPTAINTSYGVDLGRVRLVSFRSGIAKGINIRIAAMALWDLFVNKWPDVIISRNLYASFIIAVILRQPILFETHQLEQGIRKTLQRRIMLQRKVKTVVISEKLKEYLTQHHGLEPTQSLVLHDAAPDGVIPIPRAMRHDVLVQICPQADGNWESVCGYFGHLYNGRGVEVIEDMAIARPNVLFLLFGGNEDDVKNKKNSNKCLNLIYFGHVPHHVALNAMKSVNILLMPYQESVSIGVSGHDTARWMSPMKMFEYMAAGVPIISSDLPVLGEVLKDGKNALLVPPDRSESWIAALDKLLNDEGLADAIGDCAHEDYRANHTWKQRAYRLVEAARGLG